MQRTLAIMSALVLIFQSDAWTGTAVAQQRKSAKSAKSAAATLTRKQAQDVLRAGYDALRANKAKAAIAEFSRAINSGSLRRNDMARALYYRGTAYRAAQQPAKAISDLTSALWLKGALNKNERSAAMKERQAAYADAGVGGGATATFASSSQPTASLTAKESQVATSRRPRSASWQTSTNQVRIPQTTGSTTVRASARAPTNPAPANPITALFANLFGGGAGARPEVVSPRPQTSKPTSAVTQGWQTGARTAVSKSAVATPTTRPRPTGARQRQGGRIVVQVASYRSEAQAKTLARQLATRHAADLGGRSPSVKGQDIGNMGRFYHVLIPNWQSAEAAQPLCKKLLARGLDCLVSKAR